MVDSAPEQDIIITMKCGGGCVCRDKACFEGNWELKWSAGVTTALVAFMLISCVGGMWDYRDEVGGIGADDIGV